jgi:hypothetical protein
MTRFATRIPLAGLVLVSCLLTVRIGDAADRQRLDPDNLLLFRDAGKTVHPVKTAADWEKRRAEIIAGMRAVMGPFPGNDRRGRLDLKVIEDVDAGAFRRQLITYQSDGDIPTPAYLCIPKDVLAGKRKAAAVLCLHPTDSTHGHKVVMGLGGRKGRAYGKELAERGYVTLSPSYPHLAAYYPNLGGQGFISGTMKAIWDNSRGLDLLTSLDLVDARRGFGAIGHSLGGHNAIYTAVLDKRITVVASSCGFDSYQDYYGGAERVWYFGKGWCQIRYMPRLSDYRGKLKTIPYDFQELLGALAPRPLFVNSPLGDGNFRHQSVDRCAKAARPIYRLLGAEKRLVIRHPDCGHDFPPEMREEAYRTIDSVLRSGN